jgi:hypothetical protein
MKCNHKMLNGDSALIFDEDVLMMEFPKKFHVKCILCEQSFTLKKLPSELWAKLERHNEHISV